MSFTEKTNLASGTLYLVGTPIGNLGDISARALETLAAVDFIAAEDTRVTLKLLNRFQLKRPLVSYHAHNRAAAGPRLVERLLGGERGALVTDAGMPCLSDPGQELVALCGEAGVPVVVVPGPSAAVSALALSGLPGNRFCFEGFLEVKKSLRTAHLDALRGEPRTLIFYEAPHKLSATLDDLLEALGDRRVSLCREMTKLHEEIWRTTLAESAAHYRQTPPRGEFVLVVEGAPEAEVGPADLETALRLLRRLQEEGMSLSAAAKEAAAQTGCKKSEIYRAALEEN